MNDQPVTDMGQSPTSSSARYAAARDALDALGPEISWTRDLPGDNAHHLRVLIDVADALRATVPPPATEETPEQIAEGILDRFDRIPATDGHDIEADSQFVREALTEAVRAGIQAAWESWEPDDYAPTPEPVDEGPSQDTLARAVWRGQRLITLGADTGEESEVQLGDVLADLMHWADQHHVLWDDALSRAWESRHAELEQWPVVQVRITNTYTDGHGSTTEVWLAAPADESELEDWWQDVVYDHTGDGHGATHDVGSHYQATVVGPHDTADWLLHQSAEWAD